MTDYNYPQPFVSDKFRELWYSIDWDGPVVQDVDDENHVEVPAPLIWNNFRNLEKV
jgi:hypothetical protein